MVAVVPEKAWKGGDLTFPELEVSEETKAARYVQIKLHVTGARQAVRFYVYSELDQQERMAACFDALVAAAAEGLV